jgi:hypothetical protein
MVPTERTEPTERREVLAALQDLKVRRDRVVLKVNRVFKASKE